MAFRESGFGPGNISDLAVYTRAKYIQDTLIDVISAKSNLAKFFADTDVNAEFRQRMGLRPRETPFLVGPQIEVPLLFKHDGIQWINGASTLDTNTVSTSTLARFEWKEMVGPPMGLTRRDILLNADNETQIMNITRTQADNAMKATVEGLETNMGGTATGFELLGLQDLVEDSPTSTIGGIARTNTFWKNQVVTDAIPSFAGSDAGFIAAEELYTLVRRGVEKPDVWFTTPDIQRFWTQYLVTQGTWNTFENNGTEADIGREDPWFHGSPLVASDGIAAKHLYALNTNTIFLAMKPGQKFVETGAVRAFDSLQQINWIYAMLAFIITQPQQNGVVTDIQDE